MNRILPFAALFAFICLFGLSWIIFGVDPEKASWYIFILLVVLLFLFTFCLLGILLYFVRTKFYKRYSSNWYVKTSFKMAFFVAFFVAVSAILAILKLVTFLNIALAILAIVLFAVYNYLGRKR
jgi:amino acid transporter